ncbi:MAG: hypothetical protein LBO04_04790 [Spirochaetaceae bacterium]|jgi:hypothetical protein|nr:hypothetical protein [Spirochaetaceae bacterium]
MFRGRRAPALFDRVFRKAVRRFAFTFRGLRLAGDRPVFYIKPADGFKLPAIMQRLKRAFVQGYNRDKGRTGRLWVDRYRSRILEGEPPDGGEAGEEEGSPPACGVRPRSGKRAAGPLFSAYTLFP